MYLLQLTVVILFASVLNAISVLFNCDFKFALSCGMCSGICPYLALETCRQWRGSTKTIALMKNGKIPTSSVEQVQANYVKVVSILEKIDFNDSNRSARL